MSDPEKRHEWAEAWQRFSVWYTENYYKPAYSKKGILIGFVCVTLFLIASVLVG